MATLWQTSKCHTYNGENTMIISERDTIAIFGGAPFPSDVLDVILSCSSLRVAADGGADRVLAHGAVADYIIGDLDSVSPAARVDIPHDRVIFVDDQDSTDFEKVLSHVNAPLILGAGFLGGRVDHQMAVQTALTQFPTKRVILVGDDDIVFLCPPDLSLDLAAGTRVSLYPMSSVTIRSDGLNWPTDDVVMAPDGRIGTSNHALGPIRLRPTAAKCLVILPRGVLDVVIPAILRAPQWCVPATK